MSAASPLQTEPRSPAQLWNAAREAERRLEWCAAAALYRAGLDAFTAKQKSAMDAHLVEVRTASLNACLAQARVS